MSEQNTVGHGSTLTTTPLDPAAQLAMQPKQSKGGVFAPSDIPVIKRALHSYLVECIRMQDSERDPHPDVSTIANLLHRLGRIDA